MATTPENVQEFRGVVDQIVRVQATDCRERGRWFMDYDKRVKTAGLEIVSLTKHDARNGIFGMNGDSEHLWAVGENRSIRYEHYVGSIAVISYSEDDVHLYRRTTLDAPLQSQPSSTITLDEHQTDLALQWIRSPHIYGAELIEAVDLTDDETQNLTTRLDEINASADELHEQLKDIAEHTYRY